MRAMSGNKKSAHALTATGAAIIEAGLQVAGIASVRTGGGGHFGPGIGPDAIAEDRGIARVPHGGVLHELIAGRTDTRKDRMAVGGVKPAIDGVAAIVRVTDTGIGIGIKLGRVESAGGLVALDGGQRADGEGIGVGVDGAERGDPGLVRRGLVDEEAIVVII